VAYHQGSSVISSAYQWIHRHLSPQKLDQQQADTIRQITQEIQALRVELAEVSLHVASHQGGEDQTWQK
jgi:hypothetical protein